MCVVCDILMSGSLPSLSDDNILSSSITSDIVESKTSPSAVVELMNVRLLNNGCDGCANNNDDDDDDGVATELCCSLVDMNENLNA